MITTLLAASTLMAAPQAPLNVLVFSKTAGFRHDSIPNGQEMLRDLAKQGNWNITVTEDSAAFAPARLDKMQVAVFLNTTGDILDPLQEAAFEQWLRRGGGYVGIHSAADTEYGWEFYGKTVGAYFVSHPEIQPADVLVVDRKHPTTDFLAPLWKRTDEWYDYKAVPPANVTILARLDTKSYRNWKMGEPHPIMWSHEIDKGRAWYTGMGHTKETYTEPEFRELVRRAVLWSAKRRVR